MPYKKVLNIDAKYFLESIITLQSVITSIPDAEETNMTIVDWEKWVLMLANTLAK